MTDWATISSWATAGGTLALAGATLLAVRSANRAAQATERALLAGIRPVLVASRLDDPPEKVGFQDDHWVKVGGGRGAAEVTDDAISFVMALRNAGSGMAVLDRWDFSLDRARHDPRERDPAEFHRLTRDIYLAGGDRGFWQGAMRDPSDPQFELARAAIEHRQPMTFDLLSGDFEGGQRTISRFVLLPGPDGSWIVGGSRHWNLDRDDPR